MASPLWDLRAAIEASIEVIQPPQKRDEELNRIVKCLSSGVD